MLILLKNTLKFNNYQDNISRENNFLDFQRNHMFYSQMKHFINCLQKIKFLLRL